LVSELLVFGNWSVIYTLDKSVEHFHLANDEHTAGNCGCPQCRSKLKVHTPEEKRELREERKRKYVEKHYPLKDIPLFCKVFPEGLVGSCGFRWNGYCEVFEDSCVRWNELGDKKDYGVGKPNPFK
jgi:hypothetical protein